VGSRGNERVSIMLKVNTTHRSSCQALVGVIISSGGNILKSVSEFGPK
jgi:hypothetical protein